MDAQPSTRRQNCLRTANSTGQMLDPLVSGRVPRPISDLLPGVLVLSESVARFLI
jgi:hypothetical protein